MPGGWQRTRAYFPERFLPVLEQIRRLSTAEGLAGDGREPDVNQYILEGLLRVLESRENLKLAKGVYTQHDVRNERNRLARKYLNGSIDADGKL